MKRLAIFLLLALPLFISAQEANLSQQRMEKWEFRTNDFIDSSPAIGDGVVFFGSADKNIYALSASNGREKWRFATDGFVESTPAYSHGVVYAGSDDNSVYALNATTGQLIWRYNTSGKVYSSPAIVGNAVLVGSADGTLYSLNARTGAYVWGYNTSGQIFSSPSASADMAYFGSTGGEMFAINETTGAEIWAFDTGSSIYSSPEISNNLVYFGAYNNKVYALSAFNGSKAWEYTTSDKIISSPTVGRGMVWIGSTDGRLYALNAFNGQLLWTYETNDSIESSPFYNARSNVVYFGSNDDYIYALNASSGTLLWKYRTGNWVTSSPLFDGGMVYFGSYDKKFYAISTITSYINYPVSGQDINGSTLTIRGSSLADAGIRVVEVRVGADPDWHVALGTGNWTYTWPLTGLQPGTYSVRARATDNSGDAEIEPYRQVSVNVRLPIPVGENPMIVTYADRLRPGDFVRIEVKDQHGAPVSFPKAVINEVTYYGDANGVIDKDQSGNPIVVSPQSGEILFTVEKSGYYVYPQGARLAITIYHEDYTPYIAVIALLILMAVGIYTWKKRKEPGYV